MTDSTPQQSIAVSTADPPPPAAPMAAAGSGGGRDIGADSERRLKKAMDKLYHFPKPKTGSTGSKSSSSTSAPRFCPTMLAPPLPCVSGFDVGLI